LKIAVLGSSGSIGRQTLAVADKHKKIEIVALAVNRNIQLLERQVRQLRPAYAVVYDHGAAVEFKKRVSDLKTNVLEGMNGLEEVASLPEVDVVVTAVSGAIGLKPTVAAIKMGKTIALANKETLVTAGSIVMNLAQDYQAKIIPVDSEHSAIFQCLQGEKQALDKIILTASGGPFRGWTKERLKGVSPTQALKHPNWNMGRKISIDSATLMNKGLEVIEAHWLFNVSYDSIQVVVHPQSIIHSAVSFVDGSILAHMGVTDMRIPIQYALSYPHRWVGLLKPLDLAEVGELTFEKPDLEGFPTLKLAFTAGRIGGTMPAVLNAANEVAVEAFLKNEIGFLDIAAVVERAMEKHQVNNNPNLDDIFQVDADTRESVSHMIEAKGR